MSKILFFTNGDSNNPSVWSNVPYCFAKALERQGHTLYRINVSSPKWMSIIWNRTVFWILRHLHHGHLYGFDRTLIASFYRRIVIWASTRRYSDASLSIFTCIDDYNYYSANPTILLCDWTMEYYISHRLKREPFYLERKFINRQNNVLRSASIVVSLFPKCSEYIKKHIPGTNIHYLGGNVLNVIDDEPFDETDIINYKETSNLILFIGRPSYISGAKKLVNAFHLLSSSYGDMRLAFIGMTADELGIQQSSNIRCYGYLHKDVLSENKTYYSLLRTAKVIVNTNEEWAGFSSMIEAMYYCTPVIVTPYTEFVETFGKQIQFGLYDYIGTVDSLSSEIVAIMQSDSYRSMCSESHSVTKDFTWDRYVETLSKLIKEP